MSEITNRTTLNGFVNTRSEWYCTLEILQNDLPGSPGVYIVETLRDERDEGNQIELESYKLDPYELKPYGKQQSTYGHMLTTKNLLLVPNPPSTFNSTTKIDAYASICDSSFDKLYKWTDNLK